MAWTAPVTAVANLIFTAAQWNTGVRDNLNETAPAKATVAGRIIVSTAANAVAEREIVPELIDTGAETVTSPTYTDLATVGPTVVITTGGMALIWISAQVFNSAGGSALISYATAASPAIDARAMLLDGGTGNDYRMGVTNLLNVTPGSNTFVA